MLADKEVVRYADGDDLKPFTDKVKVKKNGLIEVPSDSMGGIILMN